MGGQMTALTGSMLVLQSNSCVLSPYSGKFLRKFRIPAATSLQLRAYFLPLLVYFGELAGTIYTLAPSHAIMPIPVSIERSSTSKRGVCTLCTMPLASLRTPRR